MHDLIIVGAGPAGVSAALYAQSRGKHPLVIEKTAVGGLIRGVSKVSHFASAVVDEDGEAFSRRLEDQLVSAGIELLIAQVTSVEKSPNNEGFIVHVATSGQKTPKKSGDVTPKDALGEQSYQAKRVILATGSVPKQLDPSVAGSVVTHHFAREIEASAQNKLVIVNGGSDGAVKEALFISRVAREVHIVQDQPELMCIHEFKKQIEQSSNIVVHTGCTVQELVPCAEDPTQAVAAILSTGERIEATGERSGERPQAIEVLVLIGQSPKTDFLSEELRGTYEFDAAGFITTDKTLSPQQNLWIAGDIRTKAVRQIATAVSDGCLAGIAAAK